MRIKSTANKILINSLLLTVYGCFFSVQLMFGFTLLNRDAVTYHSKARVSFEKKAEQVEKNKHSDPKKVNIRLNKRFEPSIVPPIIDNTPTIPFYYAVLKTVPCADQAFSAFSHATTHSLRGPPVVAS